MSFGRSPAQLPQLVIQQGVRGIETNAAWLAEAVTIPKLVPTTPRVINFTPARPVPRVKFLDAPCSYCGSQIGELCTKQHPKRGAISRHKPHRTRMVDARLMNKALDALDPR